MLLVKELTEDGSGGGGGPVASWAALGYAQQISGADEPQEMNQTYSFLSSSTTSIHHFRDSSLRYDVHLQYTLGPNWILRLAVLARSGFLPSGRGTPWTTDEAYSLCLFYLIICRRQNLIRDGKAINWCSFPPVSQTPSSESHQETKRSLLSSIFKPQLKHYLLYHTSRFQFLKNATHQHPLLHHRCDCGCHPGYYRV